MFSPNYVANLRLRTSGRLPQAPTGILPLPGIDLLISRFGRDDRPASAFWNSSSAPQHLLRLGILSASPFAKAMPLAYEQAESSVIPIVRQNGIKMATTPIIGKGEAGSESDVDRATKESRGHRHHSGSPLPLQALPMRRRC